MNVFLGSDFHFGHNKPFIYEDRGFKTIEEHDEALITGIKKYVNAISNPIYPKTLIFLGDFALQCGQEYAYRKLETLTRIFDKILYIFGNHESQIKAIVKKVNAEDRFPFVAQSDPVLKSVVFLGHGMQQIHFGDSKHAVLSHYPLAVGPRNGYPDMFVNLCGHSHGSFGPSNWDREFRPFKCWDDYLKAAAENPALISPAYDVGVENCMRFNGTPIIELNEFWDKITKNRK